MANLAPSGKWDARYAVDVSQISTYSLAHRCLSRYLGPVPHDASYYAKCMLGGALACGFTHAGITPLDVTKCNMQVCIALSVSLYLPLSYHLAQASRLPWGPSHLVFALTARWRAELGRRVR